uniref:Uncharacterized protein n=1 Tax=Vitis vinifera TaxID=29760 RepID=F6HRJ6_VITVI
MEDAQNKLRKGVANKETHGRKSECTKINSWKGGSINSRGILYTNFKKGNELNNLHEKGLRNSRKVKP